ncbi:GIDE domain-containing protein [Eubacteriaceae bacterium ES3]|nr:GIDE domain-containing protein [Eubacteriaceae bacterium ES3]
MGYIIGILIMVGAIAYAVVTFRKNTQKAEEIQFQQTTCIKDVLDIIGDLSALDENYRHYAEVKGHLHSVSGDVRAPYSERNVAYYENTVYSVNEEKRTERDEDGNTRTYTEKVEHTLSNEKSPVEVYLSDSSSDEKVYIDMESFSGNVDLMSGCDRFEANNSTWARQFNLNFNFANTGGSRFLGYRFYEEILPEDQPMYILGELHKRGNRLYVGRAVKSKKSSHVTYKSEDELLDDIKKSRTMAIVIGVVGVIVGAIVMVII